MPDNVKVLQGVGDDTVAPPVATDEIAGIHFQKIKTGFGPVDQYVGVEESDGSRLPVGGSQLGATNETVPGTDTATSGLNGRLQRIAQRLSSLIGLLPATIGQKAMAGSLSVTLASDQSPVPQFSRETVLTLSVANAATVSAAGDTAGYRNMGLIVPSTFDGTQISFLISPTLGGADSPLYDITNTLVLMTVAAGRAYDLPGELMTWRFLKITTLTAQTGQTDFQLVLRS